MITEDFVSFETAKLLKEKGFDCNTNCYYIEGFKNLYYSPIRENHNASIENNEFDIHINISSGKMSAPAIQMAMKWLREVHRIDIEVRTHYLNYLKPNDIRYYSGKILKGSEDVIHTIYSKDTYEEVCESAIEYCLEKLV